MRNDDDDQYIDERELERMRRRDRRRTTSMVIDGSGIRNIAQALQRQGRKPHKGEW